MGPSVREKRLFGREASRELSMERRKECWMVCCWRLGGEPPAEPPQTLSPGDWRQISPDARPDPWPRAIGWKTSLRGPSLPGSGTGSADGRSQVPQRGRAPPPQDNAIQGFGPRLRTAALGLGRARESAVSCSDCTNRIDLVRLQARLPNPLAPLNPCLLSYSPCGGSLLVA